MHTNTTHINANTQTYIQITKINTHTRQTQTNKQQTNDAHTKTH